MDIIQAITLIIAIYGAFISTILGINELRKGKRVLKIKSDIATFTPTLDPRETEFVSITVINVGYRDVEIVQAGLVYNDKSKLIAPSGYSIIGKVNTPARLVDGQSEKFFIRLSDVQENIKKHSPLRITGVFAEDAEGNLYIQKIPKYLRTKLMET